MNEKVKSDRIAENTSQNSIKPKDLESHSIYTFLVAHPSILIAATSTIVAISSFFINYISYMKETQLLRLWEVDPALVSIKNQQLFYSLCFTLIFFIITFISMSLISNTYMAYKPFAEYFMHQKAILSSLKKRTKTAKQNIKAGKFEVRKLPECDKKESLYKENHSITRQIKQIRRQINEIKRSFISMLCANLFVALLLIFVSTVFVVCSQDAEQVSMNPIVRIIILISAQFFLYCIVGYSQMRLTISKKEILALSDDKAIHISDIIAEYPIEKIRKQGFKSFFTNSTIHTMLINLIIMLVAYSSVSSMPQNSTIDEQKQFKVLSIGETQYVAVYADTERMILEEATIADESVTIDTKKQRIVSADAYPFEVETFKNTIRANSNTSYKKTK